MDHAERPDDGSARPIARRHRQDASFDEDGWIKTLCQASRGYSIYEMDGRYLAPQGPVDERVLVIRFIFHNAAEAPDPRTDFLAASLEVVNHLVARRFAHELGVEEEIWFVEYDSPRLAIWRRNGGEPDSRSTSIDRRARVRSALVRRLARLDTSRRDL